MKNYLKYFEKIPKYITGGGINVLSAAEMAAMGLDPIGIDPFDPTLTQNFHNSLSLARGISPQSSMQQPTIQPEQPEQPELTKGQQFANAAGMALGKAAYTGVKSTMINAGGVMGGVATDALKDSIVNGIKNGDVKGAALGSIAGAGVAAANIVDKQTMGDKNFGAQSEAIDGAVHGVSSALMKSGNPYAMIAGAAIEGANFISKAAGQNVQGFDVDINSSGYSSSMGHKDSKANRNWGAIIGLPNLNQKKIDAQLAKRNEQAQMAIKAQSVAEEQNFEQEARMESVENTMYRNNVALAGGTDTSLLVAKRGAVLNRIKHNSIKPYKVYPIIPVITLQDEKKEEIPIAKNGAKLEQIEVSEDPNVIPSGAMHKNKNNLDLNVTKKGIPVITVEDDSIESFNEVKEQEDTLVQHAEIEEAEIIFNKELTDFIEERRKKWHADKDNDICLEVGMRLAKEIVENTKDNTDVVEKSIIAVENEIN